MADLDIFMPFMTRWSLAADGDAIVTHSSHLLPVRVEGAPAMLKIAHTPEEREGGKLMEWWEGDGAARVIARENEALLMERATGTQSLAELARTGRDDEATAILCETAARLHRPRTTTPPDGLIPLTRWFDDLFPAARAHGGILLRSAETAHTLLADPRDYIVLHGDLHHDNVLDFGSRGWLAIDPKFIAGERGFDYANIFTNPDLADPSHPVATLPGRFERRLELVSRYAKIERERLLRWILAWTGLSAVWFLGDGDPLARIDLTIAELAAAELDA